MSYYIWCENVEVCLANKETYHNKEEVLEQIKENNKRVEEIKSSILALCCGNPRDILNCKDCEGNDLDPIDVVKEKLNEYFDYEMEGLNYRIAHNVDLQYIADNWENHKEG